MHSRKVTTAVFSLVALLVAIAATEPQTAPAAKGSSKLARGKTGQHRGIGVKVYPRQVRLLDFNAVLRCHDGSDLIIEEGGFLPVRIRGGGRFADVQYGHTDTVRLKGRVGGNVVRGRIRVHDHWGKTPCDSRWFKFTARVKR